MEVREFLRIDIIKSPTRRVQEFGLWRLSGTPVKECKYVRKTDPMGSRKSVAAAARIALGHGGGGIRAAGSHWHAHRRELRLQRHGGGRPSLGTADQVARSLSFR